MAYEITAGVIKSAQKIVIYGPEGIGKSTFATRFPDPLFIDTEGSTKRLNVRRFPKPTSWEMLKNEVREAINGRLCKTLIIDTFDWAEQLCIESICSAHQKKGIEDFGYGNGYVYEKEEIAKFLNLLQEVVDSGIHVVLTAHAQIRKFEQPDELGAYDRWELKLGKKTSSQISPLVKEWADMVLFANFRTYAVAVDKEGKKHKAQGGERVMYTSHHPCWDAKNRDGLPAEMPFDYSAVAHLFADNVPQPQAAQTEPTPPPPLSEPKTKPDTLDDIPAALRDLMAADGVSEEEIREVVAQQGYCPVDMPISAYPPDFITGVLVADWQNVLAAIREMDLDGVPF